jgi:antitoxin ParD1/3/4
MTKQSVNFTPPNDNWLNAKVVSKEYPNKTDVVNDLIRRERKREEKFQILKAAIEKGLSSGITDKTVEDIRNDVLEQLSKNGQLPDQ